MATCGGVSKNGFATLGVGFSTSCPLVSLGPSAPKIVSCEDVAIGVGFSATFPMTSLSVTAASLLVSRRSAMVFLRGGPCHSETQLR
jgi:hypothetical protein